MKTTFKLSALALVMALTACGSSGGGDSTSSKPVVENTNSSSQNPATTNGNGAGNTASQTETTPYSNFRFLFSKSSNMKNVIQYLEEQIEQLKALQQRLIQAEQAQTQ